LRISGSFAHIYIALIHYPVYDRQERVIATALTTIDIHDLARLARTYGVGGFYLVTPLKSQQELAKRVVNHWVRGWGAEYNPTRKEALSLVRVADDLEGAVKGIEAEGRQAVKTIATAARRYAQARSFMEISDILRRDRRESYLILFGTGWGLTRETVSRSDYILEPIEGRDYNHLSVRTAAAIILDRLLGGK